MLLAIETSCDETAIALFRSRELQPCHEAVASQVRMHEAYGGVVPELAAREHLRALPLLVRDGLRSVSSSFQELSSIAVTLGPGLQGCLLVGVSYAKALGQALHIPVLPIHHIEGHIAAAALGDSGMRIEYPALALVVSGGHSLLVRMEDFQRYALLTETLDDAAGEAFDKIATLLRLPYPGGPQLSKCASFGNPEVFDFPRACPDDPGSFSFSGLKTAVARVVTQMSETELEAAKSDIAASAEAAIVDALLLKLEFHAQRERPKMLILCGGVAANQRLRAQAAVLSETLNLTLCVPPIRYCTDNAAMIGVLAQQIIETDPARFAGWKSDLALGPDAPFDLGPRSRWPLSERTS